MRTYLLAVFMALVGVAVSDQYTTKYDNIDLDQIIKSDRLMKNYIDCVLDRGNCTPDGAELKKNLPDALQTDCSKCSKAQEEGTKKILKYLVKDRRQWFDELAAKFDPENTYRTRHKDDFAKEGIVL